MNGCLATWFVEVHGSRLQRLRGGLLKEASEIARQLLTDWKQLDYSGYVSAVAEIHRGSADVAIELGRGSPLLLNPQHREQWNALTFVLCFPLSPEVVISQPQELF